MISKQVEFKCGDYVGPYKVENRGEGIRVTVGAFIDISVLFWIV